jgi:hypothetical protein
LGVNPVSAQDALPGGHLERVIIDKVDSSINPSEKLTNVLQSLIRISWTKWASDDNILRVKRYCSTLILDRVRISIENPEEIRESSER